MIFDGLLLHTTPGPTWHAHLSEREVRSLYTQALVQWMQKHARVLTTPSTPEGQVAGPSLPEQVEELHNAEAAASEADYWPVGSEVPLPLASRKVQHGFSMHVDPIMYHMSSAAGFPPM